MSNRWLRFGIALLAIGAAGAAGYRLFQQEQRLAAHVAASRAVEATAEAAIVAVSDVKAALHAYVAEGQGEAFWTSRAATLIERLRAAMVELDAPATAAGAPLTDTLDLVDRLGAAEQRARDHVREGQRLLAGEVIFTEARDLLDGMRLQLMASRKAVADAALATHGEIRREQWTLALAAGGILAFAALLLVIPGTTAVAPPAENTTTRADNRPDEFESSARVISRTPVTPTPPAVPHSVGDPPPRPPSGTRRATATAPGAPAPGAPSAPSAPSAPGISLRDAAAVCTDLGRVSQSIEIETLLERAATVLTATGAIVWLASPDRSEMYPAASAGYDDRLLARIGSIARDASNVTAAAFRDAAPRTSARSGSASAALAVPLLTPLGPVGVFSVEIRDVASVDESRLAIATIFAAQLATLLGSMTAPQATAAATGTDTASADVRH
jgi:hypothetical protein